MSENRSLHSAIASPSEEDTFNRLRRTPILDMDPEYRARWAEFYSDENLFTGWLNKHGWNKKDFFEEGKKYEKSLRWVTHKPFD